MKLGFKHTELGIIPEAWDLKPLTAITDNIMVGIASAATHAYRSKGVPLFRNQNIKPGKLDDSDLLFVAPEYEAAFKNKRLRAGDLVTMRTGYPGVTAVVPAQYESSQSFTTLITRPRPQQADSFFLCYFINSELGRKFFEQSQIGGAQKNVNAATLRQMAIPLPNLPEQRAIAQSLGDVDSLIASLDRLIAKKRDIKQATMQQLLTGKTRLPGFSGKWNVKALGELGTISGGGVDKKIKPGEVKVRLVNYMDVYRRNLIRSVELEHVVSAPPDQASRCAVRKGDVFFTPSSEMPYDIAASAVAAEDIPDACYSYHVARLRLHEEWDIPFRAYAFKTQAFLDQAAKTCEGSGVRYVISQGKFRQLTLKYPADRSEQAAIATVLSDMDAELATLEQRSDKPRALKQGMMQELLTGRTRLV